MVGRFLRAQQLAAAGIRHGNNNDKSGTRSPALATTATAATTRAARCALRRLMQLQSAVQ